MSADGTASMIGNDLLLSKEDNKLKTINSFLYDFATFLLGICPAPKLFHFYKHLTSSYDANTVFLCVFTIPNIVIFSIWRRTQASHIKNSQS